jgi:propionyl-CoA carboxylase beta chain
MPIDKALLDQLEKKRKTALLAGGQEKLDARKAKGLMSARERLMAFFQPGTFQEWGMHVDQNCHNFGMSGKSIPTDGIVTGIGLVDGRVCAAFAQDFTVNGGSLGSMHAKKITQLQDYALKAGIPVFGFNDSGGARIQEGDSALAGYGSVFYRNVQASGVIPQIAIIAGPCAGGAAYSPALMDFLIMVKGSANMFICGPEVIQAVTGQKCTMEEIGSPTANASVSGNVHFIAENDAQAVNICKKLLSFLPSNNMSEPPHQVTSNVDLSVDTAMADLVPADSKLPLDMLKVIQRLVDNADFLQVHELFAKNMIVGFGRIQGVVVGIIANNPTAKAGTIDIDASDKAARFIRFCNAFNIPIVTLVDVPGFMPGVQQERGGIIRHGAKMLFAYASATVPKITVILRKAYGGAYLAMCNSDMGADMVFAWPTAEIAVMGAEGAVKILFKKEITAASEPKAREAELVKEYREKFCTPYEAAKKGYITDVITPGETRAVVTMALRNTLTKREIRPAKKHGNIPL